MPGRLKMSNSPDLYVVQIGFAANCYLAQPVARTNDRRSVPSESPPTAPEFSRHSEVLVRTPRGVELGKVLQRVISPTQSSDAQLDILRGVTRDDRLLIDRLQRYKIEAVRQCQKVLAQSDSDAVLLDVDQLFDGNTLVLHFLGPLDALGSELTDEIVRQYENEVQSIRLSELMSEGCGPGCGTDAADGCGTAGGCQTCSVACKVKPATQT